MSKPKVGDYIIGKDEIWEITELDERGNSVLYNISKLPDPGDSLLFAGHGDSNSLIKEMRHIPYKYLSIIGRVVPKEESEKIIEVLFKSPN